VRCEFLKHLVIDQNEEIEMDGLTEEQKECQDCLLAELRVIRVEAHTLW
jgi:hypothetical protein